MRGDYKDLHHGFRVVRPCFALWPISRPICHLERIVERACSDFRSRSVLDEFKYVGCKLDRVLAALEVDFDRVVTASMPDHCNAGHGRGGVSVDLAESSGHAQSFSFWRAMNANGVTEAGSGIAV